MTDLFHILSLIMVLSPPGGYVFGCICLSACLFLCVCDSSKNKLALVEVGALQELFNFLLIIKTNDECTKTIPH